MSELEYMFRNDHGDVVEHGAFTDAANSKGPVRGNFSEIGGYLRVGDKISLVGEDFRPLDVKIRGGPIVGGTWECI